MLKPNFPKIEKEKFQFVAKDQIIHDEKLETKSISYLQDAWIRFCRNKGSVVAAIIIIILVLFAIFVPIFSKYDFKFTDGYYAYALPKSEFLSQFGILTGNKSYTYNQQSYDYYNSIPDAIVKVKNIYEVEDAGRKNTYYDVVLDTYKKVGYIYKYLTKAEYENLVAYEKESGRQVLYPIIDTSKIQLETNKTDANYWYEHTMKGAATYDENGDYINIFKKDETSPDGYAYYLSKNNGTQYQVRVLYHEYFIYEHGFEPSFLFGIDGYGQDILIRLAMGARLSLILGVIVSVINLILGTIYGALEGYYGGKSDLIMQRIADVLSAVPFIVSLTLFQMYFGKQLGPVITLLLAFILTGWIGVSNRVRTQFYRFKGQEYVLAARTLGAKDKRIIFRHILPNALGTLITSSVLMVPSVIFSESMMSYLGIIDFQTSNITSVGTMLSNGQAMLSTFPHVIFTPALFISLLMISFNIFGNGLRDAFNPSLRGAEE